MVGSIWLDGSTTVALISSTQVKSHTCLSACLECQSQLTCAALRCVCCVCVGGDVMLGRAATWLRVETRAFGILSCRVMVWVR